MEEYFKIKIKNHKGINKKLIFIDYIKNEFKPSSLSVIKEMIKFYKDRLSEHEEKVIVIFDLRSIKSFDKSMVWAGASELKRHESFFMEHLEKAYLIIENKFAADTLNLIIKIVGTNIENKIVTSIEGVLKDLN